MSNPAFLRTKSQIQNANQHRIIQLSLYIGRGLEEAMLYLEVHLVYITNIALHWHV